jgi:NADP-dependent 3-hydroxy acid dehydrogenase YdfG
MQLDQKVAIITGADSGIGRAIAIQFAKEMEDSQLTPEDCNTLKRRSP